MNTRKESRLATREKRLTQTCKVYEVKVDYSKLSKTSLKHLAKLFLEAKWLYNHVVSQEDIANFKTKIKEVPVMLYDADKKAEPKYEMRDLSCISSQMKQGIQERAYNNIKALSASKKKGRHVGKLKFKSRIQSVPLVQHNFTYTINRNDNTVKIQGLKQKLIVRGLKQLPASCDIANANLIQKPSGYYIKITTFQDKVAFTPPEASIGIDFGCDRQLTLSNGITIQYNVPVSKKLKRLDRKIMKNNRKNSNNKRYDQLLRQREYERLNNIKKDIKNKIVHSIVTNYKTVCFQDENIHAWQTGRHGKKIQNTAIGGIISDLKLKAHTPIEVDRMYPSTQLCPQCGQKNKQELSDRVYICPSCKYTLDRDVKSAIMIEKKGLSDLVKSSNQVGLEKQVPTLANVSVGIPTERREVKPQETDASVNNILTLTSQSKYIVCKQLSVSGETQRSLAAE